VHFFAGPKKYTKKRALACGAAARRSGDKKLIDSGRLPIQGSLRSLRIEKPPTLIVSF
jgi:hypothetical protein